ncbi:MAG: CfrBI family restriction endonuclease [Pyrinomonadaceae bacterium]
MTLTEQVTKNIIKRLLKGEDYRIEVVALINAEFLQFAIEFFKKVAQAKFDSVEIDGDWYKNTFLNESLSSDEIAINSGLNKKTITNMYNSANKQVVIDASNEHYDTLYNAISDLIQNQSEIDLMLTIKFKQVSIELNINESLLVINTLAVKRAALRGGLWSTAGKKVEKPLMLTLCKLYQVANENYSVKLKGKTVEVDETTFEREIDFYFIEGSNQYKCEVKLMGKGNPESADAVIARDSRVFVADKLSDMNKRQLNSLNVDWIELRSENGFQKFASILDSLKIIHGEMLEVSEENLESIFDDIFK